MKNKFNPHSPDCQLDKTENHGDELLPCPFCGGKPATGKAIHVKEHNSWLPEFVECHKCRIGFYQTTGAIERWNTRHDSKPPTDSTGREKLVEQVKVFSAKLIATPLATDNLHGDFNGEQRATDYANHIIDLCQPYHKAQHAIEYRDRVLGAIDGVSHFTNEQPSRYREPCQVKKACKEAITRVLTPGKNDG